MDPDVGDARRSYLAGLLRGLWAPRNTRLSEAKASQQALTQFLDEVQCNVLHARLASGSDEIRLTNALDDEEGGNNDETAAFLKLQKAVPLTADNMSTSVQLTSALQTPLQSLYQTVHQVYAPLLLRDDARASQLSQKLKDVLLELDAGLAGTVLIQGGRNDSNTTPSDGGDDGLMSIATMSDEFAYWEAMQADPRQARRAKKFSAAFDTVHQRFTDPLGNLSLDEMTDLLDDASNVADDLWRLDLARDQVYPQRRMNHLLGLVTGAINAFVLVKAKALNGSDKQADANVWQAPFHAVHQLLQQGVALCEKWRNSIESLTGTLWPAHSEHAWEGPVSPQAQRVQLLSARLDQVLRVRTTYEELHALLPSRGGKNQDEELAESCFKPFERLRPLYYNAYTEPAWQRALSEFDRSLAPMEMQVAVVLRERLRAVTSKSSAAARLLQRYQHLLQRPTLAQALAGERDALLAQLLAHVDQLDSDFETRRQTLGSSSTGAREKKSGMHVGKTLSSDVNVIVWAHALGRRVAEMQRLARGVLADLPALPRLSQQCDKLAAKASGLVLDRVRDWQDSILLALDEDDENNGGQSLRLRGRLMQIDKQSGDLVVNFSEFLVTLLRDVRQLTELSSQQTGDAWVPTRVRQVAEEAEKYYRFGVTLQKVANFYNSIEAQIIDEQKPMLLDSLLAFEDAVQRPGIAQNQNQKTKSKDVTWANLDECDEYVNQLQTAADRLAAENRRFKRAHEKLGEDLLALLDIDLLRHPAKWKERWDEIKRSAQLVTRKQDSSRTAKWFLYWDHQLYKVFDSGYQLGLETLNENLPEIKEIKTEMHFPTASAALASSASGGTTLVLKPPVEELRTTYYKAMKKFVARPTKFGGFANSQVFAAMCDANARNLVRVYEACERLFTRLEGLLFEYEHWGFLARLGGGGNVDLDAVMEATLQEPADWEVNFKTIRTKRKESEKIPDFVKLDCINVSLVPFKRALDEHLQRFTDALLLSLRKSTLNHIRIVEDFVEASMESLNKRPHSIDEISAAQVEWKDIDARKGDAHSQFQKAEKKKTLLLAVLGGGSSAGMSGATMDTSEVEDRLTQLPTRWENFEIALEAFNDMIEEQRESLKGEIEAQVVECNVEIDKFRQRWTALRPVEVSSWEDEVLAKVYSAMTEWREKMEELKTRGVTLTSNCAAFSMTEPVFDGLAALDDDVCKLQRNWDTYRQFREEIQALAAQDWFAFCTNMFELPDTAQKWADALKEQAANGAERTVVVDKINDFNTNVKRAMPTLKLCRGEPFKDDHWTQLFRKLGFPRGVEKHNLTVQHFMDVFPVLELPATLQFVKVLHARAQGEVTIRDALQELRAWTETAELALLTHEHDGRRVAIIKDWKDLTLALGDNQSLLASLKESQFFKPFEVEASQYEIKMSTLDQVLTQLNLIQRKWVFLEPIFSKGALPSEQSRFRRVDEEFTDIMGAVERDPKLFNLADDLLFPQLVERLTTMVDQLERCQKALADFLEEKRSRMPRFYFIGDEDLLEILGQAQNSAVIQSHLKKLYQGVYRVEFSEQQDQIVAMLSAAGERVELHTPVAVTSNVEEWLETFTNEMRRTIRALTAQCVNVSAPDYHAFPSQVLCLTEQIRFCSQAEAAIKSGGVQELKRSLQDTLRELTSLDLSTELLMSLKVKALVLDLVHHIDVCDQLLAANCRSVTDWIWQKQLRFYLDTRKQSSKDPPPCLIQMNDAKFAYTYEYQGNAPKLVHTPLTDKCYLTLTQGMHMGFGGNPYGPAGTGKTESVKALGGQFGRQVLVFNCDEGIDFQSMGRIFIGLVKCGAWGCFDEFNRLKEDQLSAISQQIQVIQDAIKEKTGTINLLNRSVDVDFNAGIFVTLNPAGKGYGGRSKLPDNLKALFRPVAMGRPDNNLIAEVILYSEGFSEAKDIASKVVSLYSLSGQLLSRQQHYDWGLRALKAVLNTAGKLLQTEKKERATSGKASDNGEEAKTADSKPVRMTTAEETEILIKAVRINTLSKLTFVDSTRFLALIGDVFPGVESADLAGGVLGDAIREVMTSKPFFLEVDELQIRKMLQLKESLDQRMGCVVVGPSGSGKSTVWQVLQQALIRCGQLVKTHVMNPKSMPRERLLGHMDLDTREWEDGVLTAAARQVVKEPENVRSWIICDGDVDPEWIESLNSVLDDNHLLTLPNGERINFGPNVNFVFETHDLRFASPATISRMGMIFLSDEDMVIQRLVSKWLLTLPPAVDASTSNTREALRQWIDELFTRGLEEVHKYDAVVATTTVGTIMNGLSHVATATTRSEFVCAMIRGLGANLAMGSRASFAKSLFMMANERPPDMSAPLDCYCQGSTFYTYETKRDTYGAMDGRMDRKDLLVNGLDAVVPTVSVQRGLKLIEPWVDKMEPFILVGPEGSGKNMLIRQAFKNLKSVTVSVLHCNAQTTADHVIHKIAQCCSLFSTPSGRVYRPRDAERLVLYLKDINLPKPDQYDTCMLIAFLQQLITFNGFYDQHLEFLGVEKIQLVASMNAATTVGRHPLSTRFTAIVKVAYMDYPLTEELAVVYSTFLEGVFDASSTPNLPATWRDSANRDRLAKSMVEVYDTVKTKFTVDEQRHYLFTPRDLTKWVFALVRYDLEHEDILDALAHEGRRLFRDRLVDNEAKSKFDGILNTVWKQQWRHAAKLQDVYFSSLHCRTAGNANGDATTSSNAAAALQRIASDEFSQVVSQGMVLYEREEKDLHMLLFDEILEHLTIIERVMSEPGGSMLLVGNSGVGRRSATTLISYILNYTMFSPSITRNYDAGNFRTDLKTLLVKAGVEGQHYVLYLEDHHFTQDAILELTNSLLSSGEVPGLYTHEEIEPQIAPLKELMLESIGASGQEHIRTVYDFFVSRVRQFVHVVLAMDSRNPQFVLRCESNPALYTRCTIVWMGEWNTSSMARLPELLLNGSELVDSLMKTTPLITSLYASCKEFGATPREFICFLGTWRTLFEAKCKQIVQEIRHLKSGLSKLEEASVTVDELSRNAVVKKKDLSAAQVSADEAMKEITNALDSAADNRREVEKLKEQLAKAEIATNARKHDIEQELSEITPILRTAMEAVGNIKSDNLNEIRSLKMPPEPIHDVLSAVLMLLGIQDTSWNSMKKFLGNRGVKDEILNYDAHRITPEISKTVTKLVKSKNSSFDHETIYRVSVAAAPLATWVKANLKYSMVLNKIEPLENDLAEAKRSLEASQQRLLQCESELKKIDVKVDQMKVQFGEKTKEAEILKMNLEQAEKTLTKAQGLLSKLGGEKHRWSEQVKELEHRLTDLPVRMLLASAFTTFLGKCSEDARKRVVKEWERDILDGSTGSASSLHFDYRKLLSTESELLTWKAMGLPSDNLSMENALIVANSSSERCPFIIDPASASTTWLQAELAKDTTRPLSIVQSQDARFVNLVEQAVRFGKTLVILEVDNVEPYLYPLVRKDLIHQGPRFVVALGDKVIDYNENFRLYLVTRNPSPPLAPDALAIVNVVNFTVTRSGLEGQLLGVTIQHEQPELEQEKSELLRQEEECKVQLAALEKQLVEALATSEGDILENTILVESLTKTKATSAEIENALERSAKKSEELDEKRDTYCPFAHEGAKMFFLVKQLSAVNHMYRFSLASFLGLFKATLATKMESSSTKDRILRLIPILEYKLLMFVGRALFKEHRPMFGLHLVHGMHPECFEKNEYKFFCGELVETEKGSGGNTPLPEWTSPERKEAYTQFVEALPRLAQLCKFESHDMWIRWSKSMECEQNFHPKMDKSGSSGGLSAFQKLLVVQALRPDRLQSAIIHFICGVMQLKSLTPPSLDFKVIGTEEATNTTPVLLLTTAGADPSKELEEVATSVVGKGHYFEVAMGGGQQEKALNLLKSTAEHGEWLCLQNLHLVIAWLPVLEKEFSALNASHKFRLWLTTEPHDAFPLVLLEQSLKITFESPPGMKKNLQRTYAAWNPDFIARGSTARAQLLFLLAWFHALLQERRTYIPQGWTKFYEFSFGDFRAGSNVMELACQTSASGIDWQTLHGLMENAIYGGRIDNPYDLRVLRCNLVEYFSQELLAGQKSLMRGVKLPQSSQHADYLDVIDRFPDLDAPAMFGLPDNIERSMQRSLSGQVIAQLEALSSSEAEATTFDREKWRAQLGPLLETWGKLTSGFQLEGTASSSSTSKNLQAMAPADAFVAQENEYALDLVQQVNSSLQALKKVIYGTGLLTPAIQTVAIALLKGAVPTEWSAQWESSETVATWLRGLAMRKRALSEWQEAVGTGQLLTKGLDLSELLHPGTFLNALRQQSAREQKCSMDGMKLLSCWERERLSGTKVEWFELTRLLLQGASFEGGTLLESVSDAQELVAVPSCYVAFVREDAQEMYEKENCIKTPLYYATDRERMLVEISMPIAGDRARWVLAGVALFLGE
ncbi:Cytoplasmic dynein 2 heavy chain 1 [Phytophthora fragariae]|uniref:Cytoplasmic dynein 2 heavy chain 1 n=1 Tax=Phytophthora fragariae TaxID=53985 RepID=A0A6G0LD04_9STRA|nr:Cytoplasmic dynein 2 heavy chain 1 [Phytophthora fragariae]